MLNSLLENLPEYLTIASSVVGTAALIAAATPTPKDDGIVRMLTKVINFLGANFGKAKNADQ